jgi:hypothetical protein
MADNKFRDAKVHDWWNDDEFKEWETILETADGVLHLSSCPYPPSSKDKK